MLLLFAPLALTDLEEIGDYIALDNPLRALSFVRELRAQCRKILDNPLAFPAREDLAPGLRVLPYGHYLIFYRPTDSTSGSSGSCTAHAMLARSLRASKTSPAALAYKESDRIDSERCTEITGVSGGAQHDRCDRWRTLGQPLTDPRSRLRLARRYYKLWWDLPSGR